MLRQIADPLFTRPYAFFLSISINFFSCLSVIDQSVVRLSCVPLRYYSKPECRAQTVKQIDAKCAGLVANFESSAIQRRAEEMRQRLQMNIVLYAQNKRQYVNCKRTCSAVTPEGKGCSAGSLSDVFEPIPADVPCFGRCDALSSVTERSISLLLSTGADASSASCICSAVVVSSRSCPRYRWLRAVDVRWYE